MEKVVTESKWQTCGTFDTVFWHNTTEEPVAEVSGEVYNASILFCPSHCETDKLKEKYFALNSAKKINTMT
jgi:hypothetical protein